MIQPMRTTTDTYTGKRFRWNTTASVDHQGRQVIVPARCTNRDFIHLHPERVPAALLAELNASKEG